MKTPQTIAVIWGFLAAERPTLNLAVKEERGSFDMISRRNILRRLLEEKKEIGIKEYLDAIKNSVSRQQAAFDIKSSGFAERFGSGRGARWRRQN